MGQKTTQVTVGGRVYKEIRDFDTNVLLRRIALPEELQSLKARLRAELEDAIDDLQRLNWVLDYAVAKGDVAAPAIADGRALEAQLYTRVKSVFQEWRSA